MAIIEPITAKISEGIKAPVAAPDDAITNDPFVTNVYKVPPIKAPTIPSTIVAIKPPP